MNEIKLQGDGWILSVKLDPTITPEVKKKIYDFVQGMLEYVPPLNSNPSTPTNGE